MFIIFIIKSKWVRTMAEKTEKLNFTEFLRKYKLFIFAGLILVGLIIMIFLIYILTYVNNKPKAFRNDKNVKITNKSDYFTFNCYASKIKWDGSITLVAEVGEVKTTSQIRDVTVTFELHNNWTSKGDYTNDSEHKINSGNAITKSSTGFFTAEAQINFPTTYPIKALPFVKVSHPIVYAKVSYVRKLPDTSKGDAGYSETEYAYYAFSFSEYATDNTVFS